MFYLQVIGDIEKKEADGRTTTELGVFFYEQCSRNTMAYKKKDDKWWYVQESEVIKNLGQPKEEKLSGKRKVFYFYDIPLDTF